MPPKESHALEGALVIERELGVLLPVQLIYVAVPLTMVLFSLAAEKVRHRLCVPIHGCCPSCDVAAAVTVLNGCLFMFSLAAMQQTPARPVPRCTALSMCTVPSALAGWRVQHTP